MVLIRPIRARMGASERVVERPRTSRFGPPGRPRGDRGRATDLISRFSPYLIAPSAVTTEAESNAAASRIAITPRGVPRTRKVPAILERRRTHRSSRK